MRLQISSLLALSIILSPSLALPGAGLNTHSASEVLALYSTSDQSSGSLDRPSTNPLASRTKDILLALRSSIRRFPNGNIASSTGEANTWRIPKTQPESNTESLTLQPGQREYKPSRRARLPQPNHAASEYKVPHQAQLVFPPEITDSNEKTNNPSPHPPLLINGSSGVIHMGIPLIPRSAFHLNFTISKDVCTPLASECGCLIDDLTNYILDEYPNGVALPPPPPLPLTPLMAFSSPDHETTSAPAPVILSDTVRMDLKGREYRAALTIRLSGRWRNKRSLTTASNNLAIQAAHSNEYEHDQNTNENEHDHKNKNCDHPSHSSTTTNTATAIETTQRDEFRLILGLLGKTAKALWIDVLHRDAGFGALTVKTRVGYVDVEADWVFYENRRGVILRCDWRDVRCLL